MLIKNNLIGARGVFQWQSTFLANIMGLESVPKANQTNLVFQVLSNLKKKAAWFTSESYKKNIP